MPNRTSSQQQLFDKISQLPPEKIRELERFVDFLGENNNDERAFMRAVVKGLADIEAGQTVNLTEAKKRLGLR